MAKPVDDYLLPDNSHSLESFGLVPGLQYVWKGQHLILQQCFLGSRGNIRWEDVPVKGESSNVQLGLHPNTATPQQQRNMAGSLEMGQHVGRGQDKSTSDPTAKEFVGVAKDHGPHMTKVAARNLRLFLRSAYSDENKSAAIECLNVLEETINALSNQRT